MILIFFGGTPTSTGSSIAPIKYILPFSPVEQAKLDKVVEQWDRIWSYSSFYVERLKTVEITLTGLEEVTIVVNEFEMKLASYDSMPSDMENLRKAHDELMTLEAEIQDKQV